MVNLSLVVKIKLKFTREMVIPGRYFTLSSAFHDKNLVVLFMTTNWSFLAGEIKIITGTEEML